MAKMAFELDPEFSKKDRIPRGEEHARKKSRPKDPPKRALSRPMFVLAVFAMGYAALLDMHFL